ncbi:MAG TPA: hypothetical protein VFR37_07045 [Longimicrobium sp.]|nr:hypothetical protein [Longimicrobium sp.]
MSECLCVTQEQRDWLELWMPGGNASECVRELLDLAMRFWPAGRGTAPFTPYERRLERWEELAAVRGLDEEEREQFLARNVPGYLDR